MRLDRSEVASSLYCDNGFTANGEVCAIGGHIKGSVYLNNAKLGKLWNYVQDAAIGYGYRPTGAFLLLLVLFTAGVVVFRYVSTPVSIASGHHAVTLNNSVAYTLDLILPASALQERQVWQSSTGLARWSRRAW